MTIQKEHLILRVTRESYAEEDRYRHRLSTAYLTHEPTGASVKVQHVSQVTAYKIALKQLEEVIKKNLSFVKNGEKENERI